MRLRFCRARGLLSTSGGILFATVSGECTRNAKSVVTVGGLARLPMGSDATGSGDEGDILNNDRDERASKKASVSVVDWHWILSKVVENVWWQGMLYALRVGRPAVGAQDIIHLHFAWLRRTLSPCVHPLSLMILQHNF